jgi:hypothetical protein
MSNSPPRGVFTEVNEVNEELPRPSFSSLPVTSRAVEVISFQSLEISPVAGATDEQRGYFAVPGRASLARSSSWLSLSFGGQASRV